MEKALFSCRYFVLLCFVILYLHFLHKLFLSDDTMNRKTLIKSNSIRKKTYATVPALETFKNARNKTFFSRRKSIQDKESIDIIYVLIFPFSVLFLSLMFHRFNSALDSYLFSRFENSPTRLYLHHHESGISLFAISI